MKPTEIVLSALGITVLISVIKHANKKFYPPNGDGVLRGCDVCGCGHFGAPRGSRLHNGLDFFIDAGKPVYSPISGTFIRKAKPYANQPFDGGVISSGNTEIKMFYFKPLSVLKAGDKVKRGQIIGYAQPISQTCSGMKNHVHLEVRRNNELIDPKGFF